METYLLVTIFIHCLIAGYSTLSIYESFHLKGFIKSSYLIVAWFIPIIGAYFVNHQLDFTPVPRTSMDVVLDEVETYTNKSDIDSSNDSD